MPRRLFVISRLKYKKHREELELGDEWHKDYSTSSEDKAKTELNWMLRYSPAKEFLLVARSPRGKKINYDPDDLNDGIPF